MTKWSLPVVLEGLHAEIQSKLERIRKTIGHPGTKGDASESVWLDVLQAYLPGRYKADSAFVVDSHGAFSDQIDVLIYDRQYSPFILSFNGISVVPAESVYAVFEAKQSATAEHVRYAQDKVASVRRLHRTSLPIPHAGGVYPPKSLIPILGGLLTFESDWRPPLGPSMLGALENSDAESRLDLGCIAAHGFFQLEPLSGMYKVIEGGKPGTLFLFKLISQLQFSGTVPMIDVEAYADWLAR
jgi:hypothetical protein